jgi:hypothetical protein
MKDLTLDNKENPEKQYVKTRKYITDTLNAGFRYLYYAAIYFKLDNKVEHEVKQK